MSSVIHYKFANAAGAWDAVSFEGSSLTALQVKEAVIAQKRLNKQGGGGDFDLKLQNAQTMEGQRTTHRTPHAHTHIHYRTHLQLLSALPSLTLTPLLSPLLRIRVRV